jgi:DNA-binding transcriptional ArsR family regulator
MVLFETTDNALDAAHAIALRTAETLSDTARKIYTVLVATGLEVSLERQYSPKVTQVVFFACAESVALAVGVHPSTVYRKLPELRQAGLVHAVGHFCTHNGRTRLDGSVWAVRLTPTWGSAARVPFDFLKKQYRCLGDDIEAGRTAYQQMRESYPTRDKLEIRLDHILRWALSTPDKNPVTFDSRTTKRVDLELIFDVPSVPKQDRAETIFKAAKTMSAVLNDSRSTRFYMAVLWGLTKLRDRGAGDYFGTLHTMISRCAADVTEGWARDGNGGALFVSRLKDAPFFDEVMRQPLIRVGNRLA